MAIPQQKLKQYWADNFPELTDDWPYWWIEGDSYCLAVVDRNNLVAAVEIVEDNWEKFDLIKAHKAKLIDSDLMRREERDVVISKKTTSREYLEGWEKVDKHYYGQADNKED